MKYLHRKISIFFFDRVPIYFNHEYGPMYCIELDKKLFSTRAFHLPPLYLHPSPPFPLTPFHSTIPPCIKNGLFISRHEFYAIFFQILISYFNFSFPFSTKYNSYRYTYWLVTSVYCCCCSTWKLCSPKQNSGGGQDGAQYARRETSCAWQDERVLGFSPFVTSVT